MDRKTTWIVILTLSAIALLLACTFDSSHQAQAQQAVLGADYQLVTVPSAAGGTALYVVDNRSGSLAIFNYDAGARSVKLKKLGAMDDAFPVVKPK